MSAVIHIVEVREILVFPRLSRRGGGTGRLLELRNGGLGRRLPKDEDDGGAHWCESEPQDGRIVCRLQGRLGRVATGDKPEEKKIQATRSLVPL